MAAESARVGLRGTHTRCVHMYYSGLAFSRLEQKHPTLLAGGSNVIILAHAVKSIWDSLCKVGVCAHM